MPKTARERFTSGQNCAQSVLSRFASEEGLDEEVSLRLASGLGGGFGGLGRMCGAVSAGCMVLGLRFGGRTREAGKTPALVREFIRRFQERHGTAACRGLVRHDISNPSARKVAKDAGALDACPDYVESAANILAELLDQTE